MKNIVRHVITVAALSLALSPVLGGCSVGAEDPVQIEKDTAATQSALSATLATSSPPTAGGGVITTGEKSKGIFCTLCGAQGCICNDARDQCIECGYHLTSSTPREP